MRIKLLIFALASLGATKAAAANLRLTLPEAEARFLESNLQLLAARFGIEAADGQRIQAGVWQNPNVQVAQGMYDNSTGKVFDQTKTGNIDVQITQLILLAGKQSKQLRIADLGRKITEHQFADLLRTLRQHLRVTYYTLFLRGQALNIFETGLASLRKTLESAQSSYDKRSILLAELLRIKALLTGLQSGYVDARADVTDAQADLKTLLGLDDEFDGIEPVLSTDELDELRITKPLADALRLARDRRPDLRAAEDQVRQEQLNLSLQKSMRIPDLTLGYQYSRQGSYIRDYNALMIGFNLPIFDWNQGNIRAARANLSAKETLREHALRDLDHDVTASYQKARDADEAYQSLDTKFTSDYEGLVEKMNANYEHRNIAIIAYADFFEAFRTSVEQINALQLKRLTAFEDLNLKVGEIITQSAKRGKRAAVH